MIWTTGNLAICPSDVLRRNLLGSQFFLGWVTPQYLESGRRGWVWFEMAYAEQIELDQQPKKELLFPFIQPVFRDVDMEVLKDTPWLSYYQRTIEPFKKRQGLAAYLDRFVPRLLKFYQQELKKWKLLATARR